MAYEVTATRKRPQQFETLAGQEFVASTLTNAITQGHIAHAYLFSGPRGVGKTTTARLLAKAINCEKGPSAHPCQTCSNCIEITRGCSPDVIEIDGASNTSVNDVRNIKDEISFPPQHSKYKIYIIDEVHMLSNSAFNALLKTIEEPPEYVIFIFATTETQKVPATIRSRCQQFNFQLLDIETIKKLLQQTCDEINVKAEDQALFWIAKEATGSMRDAYTLFDQVVSFSNGEITLDKIRSKLGLIGIESLNEIMIHMIHGEKDKAIASTLQLLSRGVSVEQCIKDFADYFRVLLLIRKGIASESILGEQVSAFPAEIRAVYTEEQLETALGMFLQLFRDIRYSLNPRFELELAISRLNTLRYLASSTIVMEQLARLKNDLVQGKLTPCNSQLKNLPDLDPESLPLQQSQLVVRIKETINPVENKVRHEPVVDETPPVSSQQPSAEPSRTPARKEQIVSPSAIELPKLIAYAENHDPSLLTIIKQIRDVKNQNNAAILVFATAFAGQNAENNIDSIQKIIKDAVGFDGTVLIKVEKENSQGSSTDDKPNEDPTANLICSMFGGIEE